MLSAWKRLILPLPFCCRYHSLRSAFKKYPTLFYCAKSNSACAESFRCVVTPPYLRMREYFRSSSLRQFLFFMPSLQTCSGQSVNFRFNAKWPNAATKILYQFFLVKNNTPIVRHFLLHSDLVQCLLDLPQSENRASPDPTAHGDEFRWHYLHAQIQ